jgi:ABC-type transport system substrate-binding protein
MASPDNVIPSAGSAETIKGGIDMKCKKLVALLLALGMILSLAACRDSDTETGGDSSNGLQNASDNFSDELTVDTSRTISSESNRYESIRIALPSAANNLQPYSMRDAGINPVIMNIYECLFDQYAVDEYQPRLASGYEDVDDLHCNVTLYDNIYDTDGNHITASDVVFSYKLFMDSGYAYGDVQTYVADVTALDDVTVQFTWNEPVTSLTAYGQIFCTPYICSEKAYQEHDFANDPVGTGPYTLKEYVTGAYTILEANDNYWQTEDLTAERAARNVQTIRYDVVSDSAMRLIALENGTATYSDLDDSTLGDFIEGGTYAGQYNLIKQYSTQNQYLAPNLSEDSWMSNKDFRLAVYYAIDTEAMAIAMGENTYFPCTVDASPAIPDYQDSWDEERDDYYFTYDTELAKEYLEKSGYDGSTIIIMSGSFAMKKAQAEMVKTFLDAIGIDCELSILENAVLQEDLADSTKWDINIGSQVSDSTVAEKLLNEFSVGFGKVDGLNYCFLYDETLENMLQECISRDGYSVEKMEEILNYVTENAYSYGTLTSVSYTAYDKCYASLAFNYGNANLLPGACTYYMD